MSLNLSAWSRLASPLVRTERSSASAAAFILVPALLLLYPEYDPEQVTAISLAVVCANTISGSIAYARQGRIDYLTGFIFAASAAPGVLAGVLLVGLVPERGFTIVFALVMLALAVLALRGAPVAIRPPLTGRGVIVRSVAAPEGTYRFGYRLWQGILLSMGVGWSRACLALAAGRSTFPR